MMLGDTLRKRINEIAVANRDVNGEDAPKLWQILKNIAIEEIKNMSPERVSSSDIIPIYYRIIFEHRNLLGDYYNTVLPSNHQERFRVVIRNLFVTNSFHPEGLASCCCLKAIRVVNSERRGCRILYQYIGG